MLLLKACLLCFYHGPVTGMQTALYVLMSSIWGWHLARRCSVDGMPCSAQQMMPCWHHVRWPHQGSADKALPEQLDVQRADTCPESATLTLVAISCRDGLSACMQVVLKQLLSEACARLRSSGLNLVLCLQHLSTSRLGASASGPWEGTQRGSLLTFSPSQPAALPTSCNR